MSASREKERGTGSVALHMGPSEWTDGWRTSRSGIFCVNNLDALS